MVAVKAVQQAGKVEDWDGKITLLSRLEQVIQL
jgi:hypothetical protein